MLCGSCFVLTDSMNIVTELPIGFFVFCAIAGFIYATILYYQNTKLSEFSVLVKRILFFIRFIAITLLAFFLLSPLIKHLSRRVEKPVIIIAQDNSESIAFGKDNRSKNQYLASLDKLSDELSSKYEVRKFSFGDFITEQNSFDSLGFDEKTTNIASFIEELQTRFANKNVGALILASDGLYNKGAHPVYASEKIKYPIYTIALGDTTIKKDLVLAKIEHNKVAYLGNKFPLQLNISAQKLKGQVTTVTIHKADKLLFSQSVNINSENFNTSIAVYLDAKETGLQHFSVRLSQLSDETNPENNKKDVYIEVMDARQKIAIIADAPHPDIAAIKLSLESNQNYEVESYLSDNFKSSLKSYSLIILHSLPNSKNNCAAVLKEAADNTIPIWGFSGANGSFKNGLNYMPASKLSEAEPVLEQGFPLFTISEQLKKAINDFPAIATSYNASGINNVSNVLFNQRIGIVDTKTPLMYFSTQNDSKMAVFNGEGIWRWKLQDYAANGNNQMFDELISKTVQYLAIKEDKSFFRVITKNNFYENETVEMQAELYNESYELINDPEINIMIVDKDNKKYPFTFSKTENAYRLNAGIFPVGDYKFQAQAKVGDKVYKQSGSFSVTALQIELTNTTADHQLLFQLAKKHSGEMMYLQNMNDLIEKLNNRDDIKSVAYTEKRLDELIHLKWIFFILLFLFTVEWFIRKRNGIY